DLERDPSGTIPERGFDRGLGAGEADGDAVRDLEAGVLACVLQLADELAGVPFGDELGGEGGVEGHRKVAVGGHGGVASGGTLEDDVFEAERFAFDLEGLAAFEVPNRVRAEAGEGCADRAELLAAAFAEGLEVRFDCDGGEGA